MPSKSAAPWIAGGVVVLALADWGIRASLQRAAVAAVGSQVQAEAKDSADLRRENVRLEAEVAGLRTKEPKSPGPTDSSGLSVAQRLQALVDLKVKFHMYNSVPPMIGTKLNQSFVDAFGLNPQERATLQSAVDLAQSRLGELTLAHATMERNGDKVTVQVPPFEEGPAIYDQVTDAFQNVLGPERMAAFSELSADQLANNLGHFGAEARTFTVEKNTDGSGKTTYSINDRHTIDHGWSNGSGTAQTPADLQRDYGAIAKLLPADF